MVDAVENALQPHDKEMRQHPRKRMYRARAHSNPLNDSNFDVPAHPDDYDWSRHYPAFFSRDAPEGTGSQQQEPEDPSETGTPSAQQQQAAVRFADVGCGFGGLLVKLAPLYPDTLMLGMELRDKVSEYVRERILALRDQHSPQYSNIACLRTNAQKHLVNYFRKGQLTKLFFLFPDPHFKAGTHRRRIISRAQLADYAYLLAPGGMLYTITDVPELGKWMREKSDAHPLFQRMSDEELATDPAACLLDKATEEGQKVARNSGLTMRSVYRRLESPVSLRSQPRQ
ncbi:g12108 [Coccomyxa viridis]|uniref:tRNA (guanine-N(7)-)-methyltransferase n=1 Tax=Coccomyxa viridis TaxID=1274662 RepID=A0ABP1GAP0_9CHLO